jgi:uncharacterized protein (TIGR03086 family)
MTAELLQQAFASTAGVLSNVQDSQLDDRTPCTSWTVRDLVNHIVGGATYFAVTVETGEAPRRSGTDHTTGDFKAEYDSGAKRAVAAFAADGCGAVVGSGGGSARRIHGPHALSPLGPPPPPAGSDRRPL